MEERALERSFAQRSVVIKRVQNTAASQETTEPLQKDQDNNIQLVDFLRAVGSNIRVGLRQEQEWDFYYVTHSSKGNCSSLVEKKLA